MVLEEDALRADDVKGQLRLCLKYLAASTPSEVRGFLQKELSPDEIQSIQALLGDVLTSDSPIKATPPDPLPPIPPHTRGSAVTSPHTPPPEDLRPTPPPQPREEGPTPPRKIPIRPPKTAADTRALQARGVLCQESATLDHHYSPGILEAERRRTVLLRLFKLWDSSSNISVQRSGSIEFDELQSILQRFFGWGDDEVQQKSEEMFKRIDLNSDHLIEWEEFYRYMSELTHHARPEYFDSLVSFLRMCIGDVAEDNRRNLIVGQLFQDWGADGKVQRSELIDVLKRYCVASPGDAGNRVLALLSADTHCDASLDMVEFREILAMLTDNMSPHQFDEAKYKLDRCVEEVRLSSFQLGLNAFLSCVAIPEVLRTSSPHRPILLYGKEIDPSRALERVAQANNIPFHPFLITHEKAERDAIHRMVKSGYTKGHWLYFILGPSYDGDHFLRTVGVHLSTNGHKGIGMVHKKFRAFVNTTGCLLSALPNVFLRIADTVPLDSLHPTSDDLRRAEQSTPPLVLFPPPVPT